MTRMCGSDGGTDDSDGQVLRGLGLAVEEEHVDGPTG